MKLISDLYNKGQLEFKGDNPFGVYKILEEALRLLKKAIEIINHQRAHIEELSKDV